MSWQKELNSLFTDTFFRFLFGFTVIIALSFGVIIVSSVVWGTDEASKPLSIRN